MICVLYRVWPWLIVYLLWQTKNMHLILAFNVGHLRVSLSFLTPQMQYLAYYYKALRTLMSISPIFHPHSGIYQSLYFQMLLFVEEILQSYSAFGKTIHKLRGVC